VAKDFFQQHLVDDVKALVNFDTFKLASELVTDDELNEQVIDVLHIPPQMDHLYHSEWITYTSLTGSPIPN